MKLFSRKALVAMFTAVAVSASAVSAPASALTLVDAEGQLIEITAKTDCADAFPEPTDGSEDKNEASRASCETEVLRLEAAKNNDDNTNSSSDSDGGINPKEITKWIALIGTVVTVLTSLVTLFSKASNLFG